jgi:hypothetical protein
MISFLNALPFDRVVWLVPVFFTLHNLEEAPFMERWSRRLPLKIHPTVSTRQFVIAVTFLTVAGFVITYVGVEVVGNQMGYWMVLAIQAILFFNALIPHIAATIRFRLYSPGVITATLINIPFSVYLFQRALMEHILDWKRLWILLGLAPFAMVTFAVLSLQIGKVFEQKSLNS